MTTKKTGEKVFDCVAFKRRVQTRIYEETKGLTLRQQIAYFRQQAESGALGSWWKSLPRSAAQTHNGRAAR